MAGKTARVLAENTPRRAKRGAFFAKTRPGGASPAQKRASPGKVFPAPKHFLQKPVRVELPQRKSEHHPERFCLSRSIFDKNPFGWRFPSAKAGNEQMYFRSPPQKRRPNKCIFVAQTQKRGANKCIFVPQHKSEERTFVFSSPRRKVGLRTFVCCFPSAKAGSEQMYFRSPTRKRGTNICILSAAPRKQGANKCIFVAQTQSRRPNKCIFVPQRESELHPKRFSPSRSVSDNPPGLFLRCAAGCKRGHGTIRLF